MKKSTHIFCAFLMGLLIVGRGLTAGEASAQTLDFGDAPDTYSTLLASNGARHTAVGPRLGALVDAEPDGFNSFAANGDDLDGSDDEDGVVFITPLVKGAGDTTTSIAVTVNQATKLDAFFDSNADDDFADVGEQIFVNVNLSAGVNILSFIVPASIPTGTTFLRFRVSTAGGLSFNGAAADGEVEDYFVNVASPGGPITVIAPDGLANPLTIDRVVDDVRIRASNLTVLFQAPVNSTNSLTIEGTDGDDHFILDFAGGFPMTATSFLLKGENEGIGGDALTIKNATVTDVVHFFLTEQTGTIDIDLKPTISYTGLEPIFDLVTATNKTFVYSASSETITLEDDSDVADGESFIDSNIGSESVTFKHPSTKIEVQAGDGTNLIRVKQIDSSYAGELLVTGGSGDDFLHADWVDGNPLSNISAGLVFVSGSDGAIGDSVIVENGTVPSVDITYTSAFAATLTIDGGTLGYTTVLPVRDELSSATKIINLRASDFGGTFGDDIFVGNNRSKHTVNTNGDTYTFIDPTASVTLNGGTGNNRLVMSKMDSATNLPVILNGGTGDDTFYIDFVNGNPLTTTGITFNGQGQVISDRMELLNGSADLSNYVYANANDGTITIDGLLGTYTGLEPILDHLTITDRIFTFSGVADDVTLHDDLALGNGYSVLESAGPTSEKTTFLNPIGNLTLNLGGGDDDIHIKNIDYLAGPDSVIVHGDDGDDDFLVRPDTTYVIHVDGGDPTVAPGDTFEFDLSLLSNTLLTYFDLPPDAGFWWLSNGFQNVGFEDVEFVPYQFFLLEPITTLSGVSQLPTFTWDYGASTLPNIGSIFLEADPDSSFESSLRLLKDALPAVSKTTDFNWDEDGLKLIAKTIYYWRAVANLSGPLLGTGNRLTGYRHWIESIGDLTADLNFPHDGLSTEDTTFEFTFNVQDEAHGAGFLVEVDGPLFDPTDGLDIGSISITEEAFDISALPAVLHAGGTYTWRVKTFIGSAVAGISDVATFSIRGGVIVPTPSYPVGDLSVFTNDIEFAWYPSAPFGDLLFDIEFINTSAGEIFSGTPDVSSIEGLSNLVASLLPGKNYSWRVRSTHVPSAMTSAWSAAATFSTNGTGTTLVPVLNWPIGGAQVHTTAPTLSWSVEGNAEGLTYEVAWRPRSIFTFTEVSSNNQTHVLSGLGGGITYEWKVRSVNSNGDKSAYSAVESFEVSTVLPAAKAVVLPVSDDFVISTLMPEFKWYPDGDGRQIADYDLEWTSDVSFQTVDGSVTGVAGSSFRIPPSEILDAGQRYFWRVTANRLDGSRSNADAPESRSSFSTKTSNGNLIPTPTQGSDVVIVEDQRAFLNWQVHGRLDLIDDFEVQVSRNREFSDVQTFVTDNFAQVVDGLERGALYYWRVRSRFGAHFSEYSAPRVLLVKNAEGPVQPIPASPSYGEYLNTRRPVLSWFTYGEQSTPITYRLEISTDREFSDPLIIENIEAQHVQTHRLESGTFYWRVQGVSEGDRSSPLSEISSFSTDGIAVGNEDSFGDMASELPGRTELLQNYPNPFNPETTIAYRLREGAHVLIRVYDVQGRLVRVLVDASMPRGEHRVMWNARNASGANVASGVYLYELETSGYRETRQLVLIK